MTKAWEPVKGKARETKPKRPRRRTINVSQTTYDLIAAVATHEGIPIAQVVTKAVEDRATWLIRQSISPGIAAAFGNPFACNPDESAGLSEQSKGDKHGKQANT